MASVLGSATRQAAPKASKPAASGGAMDPRQKRMMTEFQNMCTQKNKDISAAPLDYSDLSKWSAKVSGPPDSCYAGMKFELSMEFPANYPFAPPTMLFKTPIYHPNIDMSGRICLDLLKDKWSAVVTVEGLLLCIQSLLEEPNPASPLNGEAAELWEKDREEYVKKVLERTPKVAAKAAVTKAAGAKASKPTAAEAAVKKA